MSPGATCHSQRTRECWWQARTNTAAGRGSRGRWDTHMHTQAHADARARLQRSQASSPTTARSPGGVSAATEADKHAAPVQTRLSCVKAPGHPSPLRPLPVPPGPNPTPSHPPAAVVLHRGPSGVKTCDALPANPGPRPRLLPPFAHSQWSRQKPKLWFYSQSAGHSEQSGCCCHQWLRLMERPCLACCCLDSVLAVAAVVAAPENELPQGRLALVAGLLLCRPELGVGCCCAGGVCRQPEGRRQQPEQQRHTTVGQDETSSCR